MKTQEEKDLKKAKKKAKAFKELEDLASELHNSIENFWNHTFGEPKEVEEWNWEVLKTAISSPDWTFDSDYTASVMQNYGATKKLLEATYKLHLARKAYKNKFYPTI